MRNRLKFFTPMVAAGVAAAAIAAAPTAAADSTSAQPTSAATAPQQNCTSLGDANPMPVTRQCADKRRTSSGELFPAGRQLTGPSVQLAIGSEGIDWSKNSSSAKPAAALTNARATTDPGVAP